MRRGCQRQNTPLWGVPPPRRKGDQAILNQLGANIQAERKRAGLTQERLAELVDLHPRIVQKIEAGELNPKATTLIRIKKVLGCRLDSLSDSI
jgi:ribosome-binding protein aMBF1 (putative translation factor)